jgi:hypothetical protein
MISEHEYRNGKCIYCDQEESSQKEELSDIRIPHEHAEELIRSIETGLYHLRRTESQWRRIRTEQIIRGEK